MKTLEFEKDLQKLHCGPGQIFTTIRRDNEENNSLYVGCEGDVFSVRVNSREIFRARLIFVSSFDGLDWGLSEELLSYDTDGDVDYLYNKYGKDRVLLLVFQRLKEGEP